MKAWIVADDAGIGFHYEVVGVRDQASKMKMNIAHEAMQAAENHFPRYAWQIVKIPESDRYWVEGTTKSALAAANKSS